MRQLKLTTIYALVLMVAMFTTTFAQDLTPKPMKIKQGLYFGVMALNNSIGGDFDGTKFVYSPAGDEAVVVPQIKSKFGLGFRVGYRGSNMAIELNRVSQTQTGEWLSARTDVKSTVYNLDGKYLTKPFRISTLPTQFFVLCGTGLQLFTVKDGAISTNYYGDDYAHGDGRFIGIALNLGVGLDVALTERVIASGSLGYRFLHFGGVEGVSGDMLQVQDGIKGSGMSAGVGLAFTL